MKRPSLIIAWGAGLLGATGVALGAVAAHRVPEPALATAAQMLIVHAAAVLALASIANQSERPGIWIIAAALLMTGIALFAGDIASRAFLGDRLFPMAAPMGGSTLIVGWLASTIAASLSLRGRG